ncbi:GAF domain-containing SpoIIE family protein phosphatase [Actinosynnema sp. NPDC020468]|uniref:PP2C family protein-serine/threonine phosphatase n=1 Tax=Actinosynnema sp. NPDC020468 TaxID=3154488 RepID=UPI0033F88788
METPSVADVQAWQDAPYPSVLVGAGGEVRAANDAATALLLEPGGPVAEVGWLADAHDRFVSAPDDLVVPVAGSVGDRSFEAHPVAHDDRSVTWWLVEDTDVRLAREALQVEQGRAALLADVSSALLTSLNPERCMRITAELAARHLADAALVISAGSHRESTVTRCARDGEPEQVRTRIDADEVAGLGEALRGFPPVPSRWIDPASAPGWLAPDGFGDVGSIVVTPLPGHGVPAGALILLRHAGEPVFTEDEEVFARLFASRAGTAMSAAHMFTRQASITETLMRELLPPTLRDVGGIEFAGRYRPAGDTERVGGDFYDVHPVEREDGDAEALAVLGDVCGKGLEAAVLTGKVRTTVQALLPMADDHQQVLDLLNNALLTSHHTRFVTLVLASVVRTGAEVRLRLTSAGHLPPLIVRNNGDVDEADTTGTLVGALADIPSTTATVVLAPGETCLLYTDGITEARGGPLGGEMFGEHRLKHALAACAGMPADAIAEHVHMLAAQWVGSGAHDDMAVLAITAPRGRHLSAVGGHGRGRFTP